MDYSFEGGRLMKKVLRCVMLGMFAVALMSVVLSAAEEPVVFLDLSWDSIQLHNRIAGYIVHKGYGKKVDYVFSETIPGMLGLERGDIHVYIEGWVENTPEWWEKARKEGKVLDLGVNYSNPPQGWYVPSYMIEGDPERGIEAVAPDLEYVEDLGRYWELFRDPEIPDKGRFTNAPLGWNISSINREKVKSLGLDEYYAVFEPGSGTALKAEAVASYEKGEPILFYYWEPTALMGLYNFTRLKQKIPHSPELWVAENGYNCDFPAPVVLKVLNREFADENPWMVEFVKRYETTLDMNNAMLAEMSVKELSLEEAAVWFLKNYRDEWHKWIPEERQDVIEKIEAALASEK